MATAAFTYYLDDKASFYHGRQVELVRDIGTVARTVRVVGTGVTLATTLYSLSREPV